MGNLLEAMETLKLAYQTHPDNALIRYLLGDTMVRQGDLKEGIQHLQAARVGLPNFYDADVAYAYARRIQGDHFTDPAERDIHYAEAKSIFLRVAKDRPYLQDISGESAFGALAGLYRREGNLAEAVRWYRVAQQATPQNSYPINNLALCYLEMDNSRESRRLFERSRDMARSRFTLLPTDYYSRFDYVTARLGLLRLNAESYPADEMDADLVQIFELVRAIGVSVKPLRTFKSGLERLNPADFPPAAAAVQQIEAQISQMEQ
jgi:tetratricopeptide (TPR) repeat protein